MGRLATAIFIIVLLLPRVEDRYAYAGVAIERSTFHEGHSRKSYYQPPDNSKGRAEDYISWTNTLQPA